MCTLLCTRGAHGGFNHGHNKCTTGHTQGAHEWRHSPIYRAASGGRKVRRAGLYRNATFGKKREAEAWAAGVETQAHHVAASGFAPIPKGATVEMLIEKRAGSVS